MTDDEIIAIWEGMPGGYSGFLKEWGYLQFANKLLEAANIQVTQDSKRYRELRDPGCPEDGTLFACVYVHPHGTIPYQRAVVGAELDRLADVLVASKQEG